MFTSLKLAVGAGGVELEVGWLSAMFDKKCHEYCRQRRRSADSTPVGSLSIVMLAGVGWIS